MFNINRAKPLRSAGTCVKGKYMRIVSNQGLNHATSVHIIISVDEIRKGIS
jgi:hypothetical protein